MSTIAFIGLGIMGSPMSVHLAKAGHHVVGYNLTPDRTGPLVEAGGTAADSIAKAVHDADIVAIMVPDSPDVQDVLTGEGGVFDTARRDGAEVLVGNAADPEVLAAAGLDRAIRLFVAIPGSFEAGQVCQQARSDNATLPIVARAHSDAEVEHLSRCGATLTIMGEAEIARAMLSMCQNLQADRDRPPAASEEPAAAAEAEQPSQVPPPSPPAGASPAA